MGYEIGSVDLLTKPAAKVGEHYGVGLHGSWAYRVGSLVPVVVNLVPEGIATDPYDNSWRRIGCAADPEAAVQRLLTLRAPGYRFLDWNCEHFARWIVTGRRESRQLQGVAVLAGVGALLLLARE